MLLLMLLLICGVGELGLSASLTSAHTDKPRLAAITTTTITTEGDSSLMDRHTADSEQTSDTATTDITVTSHTYIGRTMTSESSPRRQRRAAKQQNKQPQQQQQQQNRNRNRGVDCGGKKNGKKGQPCSPTESTQQQQERDVIHVIVNTTAYSRLSADTSVLQFEFWQPASWSPVSTADLQFDQFTGSITVKRAGLYFTYAQITYSNRETINSFTIHATQPSASVTSLPLAQCIVRHYTDPHPSTAVPAATVATGNVTNSCYTATVARLESNSTLYIVNGEEYYREMLTLPKATFWGVYRL